MMTERGSDSKNPQIMITSYVNRNDAKEVICRWFITATLVCQKNVNIQVYLLLIITFTNNIFAACWNIII